MSGEILVESSVGFVPYPKHRTRKVNVVVISGKAQAGKSTSASLIKYLIERNYNLKVQTESLAKPIKDVAYSFFGWDGTKDPAGRRLLQEIGDAARNYNEDIFCEKLEERTLSIFPPHLIIIDDWRYANEAEYFQKNFLYDVTTVRIERKQELYGDVASHRSEVSLPVITEDSLVYNENNLYNFGIINNGTIPQLGEKLGSVFNYLSTKIITY